METWGQYGYLTPEQQSIMETFLSRAPAEHIESAIYTVELREQLACRFLRARDFSIEDSLVLLENAYNLLKEKNASECIEKGPEGCLEADELVLKTYYPHKGQGYDRYGRLLCFEHNGTLNISILRHLVTKERLISYHLYTMEKAFDDHFKRSPRNPAGQVPVSTFIVCDFENLAFSQVTQGLDHLYTLIQMDNICYPEMLGKMMIINVPATVAGIWNMVKGWLAPRTRRKIEILASGPEVTRRLKELISPENLPRNYGGLAPDPFKKKAHTEHLSIPSREGEVKRTLRVAPGLSFRSDNYVSDGPIEITISFTTDFCADPEFIENKKIMEPSVQDEPTRFIFSAPPSSEERVFTVAWKNSHWISSRNIVYCLEATTETDGLSRSPSDRSFSDTPHKMAEAPVYKVMTVEGIIVEGGHSPRKNAI